MKSASILLFLVTASAMAQQLPAGTRDAAQPPPPDPTFAQAEAALEKQDYAAALPLLSKLAASHPDDPTIAYDLGYTEDGLDHAVEAESAYRKAISLKADYGEAHLSLGLLLAREGLDDKAHDQLLAARLSTDPQIRATADRAMARLDQTTHPEQAREELLEALKLSPETPSDTLMAARLAERTNDALAEQAYRRVLQTQPDDLRAISGLAEVLIRLKRAPQAEPLLTAALAKHPGDTALTAQLVATYEDEKKDAQALPLAESLHSAHPQDANVTRMLAHLYDQTDQAAKADTLYAALIAQSPKDPTLLDERAAALIKLNKSADAEDLLKQAIVFPDEFPSKEAFAIAASHLAYAASANNDPSTVLQALALRAKVLPQSPSSLYLQATASDQLHQAVEAAKLYRQFLDAAKGQFPTEEAAARKRLAALHVK